MKKNNDGQELNERAPNKEARGKKNLNNKKLNENEL